MARQFSFELEIKGSNLIRNSFFPKFHVELSGMEQMTHSMAP